MLCVALNLFRKELPRKKQLCDLTPHKSFRKEEQDFQGIPRELNLMFNCGYQNMNILPLATHSKHASNKFMKTGCQSEDLPYTMNNCEDWRERVLKICIWYNP